MRITATMYKIDLMVLFLMVSRWSTDQMQIRYQSDTLNVLTCHGINTVPIISYRSIIQDTFRFHKQNSNLIVVAINDIARTTFQQPLVKTIGFFSLKSVSTCTAVVWLQVQRFPGKTLKWYNRHPDSQPHKKSGRSNLYSTWIKFAFANYFSINL